MTATPSKTPADPAIRSPEQDASVVTWLKTVLWGAFLIPLAAFAATVIWSYDRAYTGAETAVLHASALSLRQAERNFEVARRIALLVDEATRGSDDDVRAREAAIHQRLSDLCAGLPSVVSLIVWDAAGRPLARSDIYPVDPTASVADRTYFVDQQTAERPLGIGEVIIGRQVKRELFNVTMRRHSADGRFNGLVAVSLSPEFYRDYYRSLASDEPNLASFAMVRTDGALIARWPALDDGRTKVDADNPTFLKVSAGEMSGVSLIPERGQRGRRLVAFRRVGDLPVYVSAGVSQAAMIDNWLHLVALLASIFVPITIGLVYVSWVALIRTRDEHETARAMRDQIQRRATAEQSLLETQKFRTLAHLTSGVAHDFNNLLTIVSNNLHILRRKNPALENERQVAAMARAMKTGVRLTRQLLSFSKKQALSPERVALQTWLPAASALIRSTLGNHVVVDFHVDADTDAVLVDPAELELALINTAVNAQHAMPTGGAVRVTAKNSRSGSATDADPRSMVVVRIEDNGKGIPPEIIARVFEPFFTTKEAGSGSGLGLSQVFGFCERAGGYATVESTVGRGTTIGMYFPAVAAGPESDGSAEPVDERRLAGRVLLVEDNAEVQLVTEQLLVAAGLEVVRAADAHSALGTIERDPRPFDLVLSDISMPGPMDGIELAFLLKTRYPDMPVLLVTGYATRIDEAVAAGLRVLAKPVAPDALLRAIAELLDRRQDRDPTRSYSDPTTNA